ncbi:MAG TPA: trypsin-like peptidase domain-containing protein [Ktedonobacterales bacterium]
MTQQDSLSGLSDQIANAVEKAAHSLVTIAARPRQSATGILWKSESGELVVVTADHIVEREEDIKVTLPDHREVVAQLAGRDPGTDIAVLRLPGVTESADVAPATTADGVRIGSLVLAAGRPTGDGPRVSFGAVSAIEGPRRTAGGGELERVIFADVVMYPGFSGGALIDLAGNVVGMVSSQLTRHSASALPASTVQRVTQTLLTHGRMRRGYLGVGTQQSPISPTLAQRAGLSQTTGLLVMTIEANSPAEQAGFLIGDIIIGVDGQPATDVEGLRSALGSDKLGKAVTLRVLRGGEPKDVSVTVGERP